ncbi:hypothetical protein BGX38DRAFT_1156852 [Terfezia claveryi]|nr:hypothetical protein BGX38DRAFT_1156852 [Terfezia claveryi]
MSLPPNQPKITHRTANPPPGGAGTTAHPPRFGVASKNNLPLILGGAALLAGAYYMYGAGGDTKVAKESAERDATSASARLKEELPGGGKEGTASAEETLARIGSQVDKTVQEGKHRISEASQKLEEKVEDAKRPVLGTIDEMDKKIEKEASKAKSGISSWFGFGK